MEIEVAECECCGLKEECTEDYITSVKDEFDGKWLCGLCSEAVRDENRKKGHGGIAEALMAHVSFCSKLKLNPALQVADCMREMLRRRLLLKTSASSSTPKIP